MDLSDRQKDILSKAVFEYIDRAEPISSGWLEARYDLAYSPATIRHEMLLLAEKGYLEQPHVSAGRVPTDRGYRFFVNELIVQEDFDVFSIEGNLYEIGKRIAQTSSNLLMFSMPERDFLWKEGWEQVLQAPEFETRGQIGNFTKFLNDVEIWLMECSIRDGVDIYIGEENRFSKEKDFSVMVSAYSLPKKKKGIMALVGPKRMPYQKNIGLFHSIKKLFV